MSTNLSSYIHGYVLRTEVLNTYYPNNTKYKSYKISV